jgi:hypothetical protein
MNNNFLLSLTPLQLGQVLTESETVREIVIKGIRDGSFNLSVTPLPPTKEELTKELVSLVKKEFPFPKGSDKIPMIKALRSIVEKDAARYLPVQNGSLTEFKRFIEDNFTIFNTQF